MNPGSPGVVGDRDAVQTVRFDLHVGFVLPRRWRAAGGLPICRRDRVVPRVDGVLLTDLVDMFELSAGMEPARGMYGGIVLRGPVEVLADSFRGNAPGATGSKVPLLGCECGETGCWPLPAAVTVTEDLVVWDRFEQPFRPGRDYAGFGPFRFARGQYEDALRDLVSENTVGPWSNRQGRAH
ncbi:hypothetical protein ACWDOP_26760 [Nocardia sp. NPDC003693]